MKFSQTYTRLSLLVFLVLSNLTYSQTCSTTISSFPYSEGFESGIGSWTQDAGDNFDWLRDSAGTPSSGTGPCRRQQLPAHGHLQVIVVRTICTQKLLALEVLEI